MGHTYARISIHAIFATRDRRPCLSPEVRGRLFPYLAGVAKNHDIRIVAVGGVADHVHTLIEIPPRISVAKAAQTLKGISSKWIHETFPAMKDFWWQEGYGAFSVSVSHVPAAVAYIQGHP